MQEPPPFPPFPGAAFRRALLVSLALGLGIVLVCMLLGFPADKSVWAAIAALLFGWLGEAMYRFLSYDPRGRR